MTRADDLDGLLTEHLQLLAAVEALAIELEDDEVQGTPVPAEAWERLRVVHADVSARTQMRRDLLQVH